MKLVRTSTIAIIACVLFCLVSCTSFTDNPDLTYKINFIPCDQEDMDKTGFVDEKGTFVALSEEDKDCSPVINGVCLIDGTLYKVGEMPSDTIPIMRDVLAAGIMNDGLIPTCRENDYITICDEQGKELFKLKEFDGQEVLASFSYSDGKLRVLLSDGTYVFVDKEGRHLFDKRYKWATDFKRGHSVVQTVSQNSDLYSLIDGDGKTLFTFECKDKNNIVISHTMELLSAKEDGKMVIYDFSGKRILECPAKVEEIYAFCRDGFIYIDEDEKLGLMTYEGEYLIRARYEKLVPHGKNYLALTDDDEIRLVDKKDKIIKELDGKEILDFQHNGYAFPHLIEMKNHNYMIIDDDGNILIEDIDGDYSQSDIKYLSALRSAYFPEENVLSTIMELCGDGAGASDKYGAFFYRSDAHCFPSNINFLSSFAIKDLEGSNRARKNVSSGVNYNLNYDVVFDEPIVRYGATSLSTSAWLLRVELYIWQPDMLSSQAFYNKCVHALLDKGCETCYSKGPNRILLSKDKKQLFVFLKNWKNKEYEFGILMMQNTDENKTKWGNHIDKLK